jgi:hypothetical protein
MKKTIFLTTLVLVAGLFVAFMMDDDQRPVKSQDNRVSVERVLEAVNLNFHKDIGQSSIIFQFAPEDSIKIECEDCILRIANPEDKGGMKISLQSIDGSSKLMPNSFNRWMRISSSNGKVGIVFERDGFGEKVLDIRSLKVLRKTRSPFLDIGGVPMGLLDVNNLYIDKLTKDNTSVQTTFFFKLKTDDKVQVDIIGANGAVPSNLICSLYKTGEEYDKKPIATGSQLIVPTIDGGQDRFGFEFAHIKDVKGTNAYHLDISRIPLNTAGFKNIPRDSDTVRVLNPDTVMEAVLEFNEGPNFECVGSENWIRANLPGRYNLGVTKSNRACWDLQLTDDCVSATACIGCDTIWAIWVGSGNGNINRFMFQDSLRKLNGKTGLVQTYAKAIKSRARADVVFPKPQGGEQIFFAIVNQSDKARFLGTDFSNELSIYDFDGNDTTTWSPGNFVPSGQKMLHYQPEKLLSLCVCNMASVSTVPIMFRYQQFLTTPRPVDSVAKVIPNVGSLYEIDPTEDDQ